MDYKDLNVKTYDTLLKDRPEDEQEFANFAIETIFGIEQPDKNIAYTEYLKYLNELSFLSQPIPKSKLLTEFKLNGRDYTVDINVMGFSTAQFIDIRQYMRQQAGWVDMLSTVVIPKGHKYNDGYDIEQAKADIGSLDVPTANAILLFFSTFVKRYQRLSLNYLQFLMMKEKWRLKRRKRKKNK